jgi:cyclase
MLKVRLIPTLLLKGGRMVKSRQFDNFRDVGDPVSAARIYDAQNADELVFLDIEASREGRGSLLPLIQKVSKECFMPLSVGGGIRTFEHAQDLFKNGADKVVINSAVYSNPDLIGQIAESFGQQAVIVGIDVKKLDNGTYTLFSHSGSRLENVSLQEHLERVCALGAGEIFINSIDRDGMMNGYDLELAKLVHQCVRIPVIISGGAGHFGHLLEAWEVGCEALAMASIFHFGDNNPIRARTYLKTRGVPVKEI